MSLPALLRALVLLLLAAALALPAPWREPDPTGARGVAWLRGDADGRAPDTLLVGPPPALVARASANPPSLAELALLAAAAERGPVYVAAPEDFATIEATPPANPLAGRAAAVGFRVRGRSGATTTVRLMEGDSGVIDTLRVRLDARGEASGAFRVRPGAPGWREWRLETGDADAPGARTGAWVDSAGAPRVLVRAGFPDWESKFVVRALEESGARVDVRYDLGRGLAVGQGSGGAVTPARLQAADAVIVLDGAPVSGAERALLAQWAARGGGVLLAGDQAAAAPFGLARVGRSLPVNGSVIRWSLPAELAPLPGDRIRAAAAPFAPASTVSIVAATTSEGGVLALRPLGRGRAAALALTETWRWRMEAGRVAEHREFWRALVDWLASAPRDAFTIAVPEPVGAPGIRRDVLVYAASGAADVPDRIILTHPDGARESLPLAADAMRPGVLRASFVPAAAGLYTFAFDGAQPTAAFRADSAADGASSAWARLAVIAHRSGGRMVPADSLEAVVRGLTRDLHGESRRWPLPAIIFVLLVVAAGAEWAIRRLRGQA